MINLLYSIFIILPNIISCCVACLTIYGLLRGFFFRKLSYVEEANADIRNANIIQVVVYCCAWSWIWRTILERNLSYIAVAFVWIILFPAYYYLKKIIRISIDLHYQTEAIKARIATLEAELESQNA